MPRITRRFPCGRRAGGGPASMRPGRNAPDNDGAASAVVVVRVASMRPGRNAPDNNCGGPHKLTDRGRASMRPGRNAPDNMPDLNVTGDPAISFNEAGAKCPG